MCIFGLYEVHILCMRDMYTDTQSKTDYATAFALSFDHAKDILHYLQCKMVLFLFGVCKHVCMCVRACVRVRMHAWSILNCNETAQNPFYTQCLLDKIGFL